MSEVLENKKEIYELLCKILAMGINTGEISRDFIQENIANNTFDDIEILSLEDALNIRMLIETEDFSPRNLEVGSALLSSIDKKIEKHIADTEKAGYGRMEGDILKETDKQKVYFFIQSLLLLLTRFCVAAGIASKTAMYLILRTRDAEEQLDALLAAAKEAQPASAPPLTPQQKAALARQENTLNAWKPAIAAMIKVAVRCGEEGQKLRQRPDFNLMFNELNAELNGEQERFFRESMPNEHIDRLGDAKGKADPPDNV